MIKKIMITLLSVFFICSGVVAIVTMIYFLTPSRKAQAGISLPAYVEDDPSVTSAEASTEFVDTGYDNIYYADVHDSLTLRSEPDSNSKSVLPDGIGLAPYTHMQIIEFVTGTNFAEVEVINGTYQGHKGYVNTEYITKLGEPSIRAGEE